MVTTLYFRHKTRSNTLDSVSACFVTSLPASSVLLNFVFAEGGEGYARGGQICDGSAGGEKADAGVDKMRAAGKKAQHAGGVGIVSGFAKDLLIEEYTTDLMTTPEDKLVINILVPLN